MSIITSGIYNENCSLCNSLLKVADKAVYMIEGCGHQFHVNCILDYCTNHGFLTKKLEVNAEFKCPAPGCNEMFSQGPCYDALMFREKNPSFRKELEEYESKELLHAFDNQPPYHRPMKEGGGKHKRRNMSKRQNKRSKRQNKRSKRQNKRSKRQNTSNKRIKKTRKHKTRTMWN
jgi:hypothetical protein